MASNLGAVNVRLDGEPAERETMARTATSDERLVLAQFEDFVNLNGTRLLHTAYGLCGDWQHAEDLVQKVLVIVAAAAPPPRDHG